LSSHRPDPVIWLIRFALCSSWFISD